MLTLVELRTPQGSLLSLPLDDVSDGLVLEDIKGLGPVKATIVTSSFAKQDGSQYHSSRREERNILIKLGLEPDYVDTSVKDLRDRLYPFAMPKSPVKLRFYDSSGLEVEIEGRVESFDTDIFAREPKVDLSILCMDPDFLELDPVVLSGDTTDTTTETDVVYEGTTETGIEFVLNVNRTLSEFTIYHRPPDGSLRSLEFGASLVSGDVLTISTVPGAKGVSLLRTGTESSLLYGVSPQSSWIELLNGTNKIRVYAEGAAIPYTITYTNRYGGL